MKKKKKKKKKRSSFLCKNAPEIVGLIGARKPEDNFLHKLDLAEILGASLTITWKPGDNFFMLRFKKDGKWLERKVCELEESQVQKLKPHGPAYGMNFYYCLYLASRHWKEFSEQVCGYRMVPSEEKECPIGVVFYSEQ